jgi:hypothetical protein
MEYEAICSVFGSRGFTNLQEVSNQGLAKEFPWDIWANGRNYVPCNFLSNVLWKQGYMFGFVLKCPMGKICRCAWRNVDLSAKWNDKPIVWLILADCPQRSCGNAAADPRGLANSTPPGASAVLDFPPSRFPHPTLASRSPSAHSIIAKPIGAI